MGDDIAAARERLAQRFGDVRTGGKGSVRRKKKAVHKSGTSDDKRLSSTLKRLNVTTIPGIEEVNMFKADGNIIHFNNPKVQASIGANTYVVSGAGETKTLEQLLPGIINHLGPDSLSSLKQLAESMQKGMGGKAEGGEEGEDDGDDVPDLVEDFEEVSEEKSS